MNIGFTGHRNKLTDPAELRQLETDYPGAVWIHGGAQGFDAQVNTIALELGKVEGETLIIIKPDYQQHLQRLAPLIRNEEIVKHVDLLVACYDKRGKGGTFYTINYAKSRHVPVKFVSVKKIT